MGLVAIFSLGVAPTANSLREAAPVGEISLLELISPINGWSKTGLLAQGEAAAPESPTAQPQSAPDSAGQTPAAQTPAEPVPNAVGAKRPEDMTLMERIFASGIILPVGLVVLFYAIFLAPERRRKADEAKLMASLKKNDRVVTIGGIHGTVANVTNDSDIVTLKVDESSGARIRVNRSAIARIVTDPASSDKDAPADDSAK